MEKLLFHFIKLCKCTHKYKNMVFFLNDIGDAPPPPLNVQKHCIRSAEGIYILVYILYILHIFFLQ